MRRTDKLATFMCRLFGSLVVSASWNHKGLSRSVYGIFVFYRVIEYYVIIHIVKGETFVEVVLKGKGKAVPLQAWSGPEGSRILRFPDFMTTAQGGGKVVSLTHRPLFTPRNCSCYSFLLEIESTPRGHIAIERILCQ